VSTPDPSRLPRFRILRSVGKGTSGEVYLAQDTRLDREVAVKILKPCFAHPAHRKRFAREAELLARLPHPGLVPVLDLDLEGDPPFLTLAWMPGGDLAGRLEAQGALRPEEVAEVGARLAGALAHLHEHGILHRDIKPENVLLDEQGEPRLGDLGLAWADEGERLTATGHVVGTPHYMAPELLRRGVYGPGSDLFSLGVVLAELATGRRMGTWAGSEGNALRLVEEVPDPQLRELLGRLVQPEPGDRPGAAELSEALGTWGDAEVLAPGPAREVPRPPRPPPPGPAPGPSARAPRPAVPAQRSSAVPLGLALVLGALAGWWWTSRWPAPEAGPAPMVRGPATPSALEGHLERLDEESDFLHELLAERPPPDDRGRRALEAGDSED